MRAQSKADHHSNRAFRSLPSNWSSVRRHGPNPGYTNTVSEYLRKLKWVLVRSVSNSRARARSKRWAEVSRFRYALSALTAVANEGSEVNEN